MNKEMDALYENNTWEITELPSNRKAIGSKWVFKIKYKSDGEIERYKVGLVAKGFNQKEGIDFDETFSPVVKIMTVSIVSHSVLLTSMCCDDSYHVTPRISALVGCDNMHLKSHLKIALKVLRYLKGSPRKGVHIVRFPKVSLETFVDADWAKCYVTRRSVTGFCLFLNGTHGRGYLKTMVDSRSRRYQGWWITRRLSVISKLDKRDIALDSLLCPTCNDVVDTINHCLVLCNMASHIWEKMFDWWKIAPVNGFSTNEVFRPRGQAAIKIVANPVFHDRTKHLEIDLHFVREIFLSGAIKTQKISSAEQTANIFTKDLDKQHDKLISKLGLFDCFQAKT
ncbi:ribonuclease H-like domain-containing protein [Tanacetum coccineum]